MRCDDCQHWQNETDSPEWEPSAAGFGKCLAVRERWRIMDEASGVLNLDFADTGDYISKRIDALKAARAYVQDGSEYRAELMTSPGFFCALHSPQQEASELHE